MEAPEYHVVLRRSARKDIEKLDAQVVQRIWPRLRSLAETPRPPGCRKLTGSRTLWRIRIGDYRIIYEIDDPATLVTITHVRHRRNVYE